jgi:hypothetical protein
MASIFHRRPSLEHALRVALISLFGLLTTAFSAPIEDLRQEIRALKMEQATVTQREEAVMARQDELTNTIKRLKSETRGPAGPFGSRKLEAALKQLRTVLDEHESLQRRRTELSVRTDEALARLRTTVRDEILHLVPRNEGHPDSHDRAEIRALLTLYPPSPMLPSLPPGSQPLAPLEPVDPETLAEQTLLLRDRRERHEVLLQRAEAVHSLLSEELTLYRTLAEHEPGFETHWQTVDRQVAESNTLIETLSDRMRQMDDALRHLDILMSQPVTGE